MLRYIPRTTAVSETPPMPATPVRASNEAPITVSATVRQPERASQDERSSGDGLKPLLVRTLALWGVSEDLSNHGTAAWPARSDGTLDVPAIASRYQLAATELPETTVAELRAVNLPAILEMNGKSSVRFSLLRRLEGDTATLIDPSGIQTHTPVEDLEGSWGHSAWVIWRNVDVLPVDPGQEMTPIVVTTLSLRLQKLGLLSPPLPVANSDRFQQAVRRFQTSMGLTPDGIVGPRTTLALSRVVAGRFAPSLAGANSASR